MTFTLRRRADVERLSLIQRLENPTSQALKTARLSICHSTLSQDSLLLSFMWLIDFFLSQRSKTASVPNAVTNGIFLNVKQRGFARDPVKEPSLCARVLEFSEEMQPLWNDPTPDLRIAWPALNAT